MQLLHSRKDTGDARFFPRDDEDDDGRDEIRAPNDKSLLIEEKSRSKTFKAKELAKKCIDGLGDIARFSSHSNSLASEIDGDDLSVLSGCSFGSDIEDDFIVEINDKHIIDAKESCKKSFDRNHANHDASTHSSQSLSLDTVELSETSGVQICFDIEGGCSLLTMDHDHIISIPGAGERKTLSPMVSSSSPKESRPPRSEKERRRRKSGERRRHPPRSRSHEGLLSMREKPSRKSELSISLHSSGEPKGHRSRKSHHRTTKKSSSSSRPSSSNRLKSHSEKASSQSKKDRPIRSLSRAQSCRAVLHSSSRAWNSQQGNVCIDNLLSKRLESTHGISTQTSKRSDGKERESGHGISTEAAKRRDTKERSRSRSQSKSRRSDLSKSHSNLLTRDEIRERCAPVSLSTSCDDLGTTSCHGESHRKQRRTTEKDKLSSTQHRGSRPGMVKMLSTRLLYSSHKGDKQSLLKEFDCVESCA